MLQPFRTSDNSSSSSAGGKMKREASIHHESYHPPPIHDQHSAKNPVLAFLEARNNALPIKTLPAFNLNNEKSPPMIKRESTGSTIPPPSAQSLLRQHMESSHTTSSISSQDSPSASPQASPVRRLDNAQSEPATTTTTTLNFGFAMPPPLVPKNSLASLEATEASKTIVNFSFCQPEEVAQVSSMSDFKMASPHHSNSTTNTAKTSPPKTSLIATTNHTAAALPDLTATMRSSSSSHDGQNNIKSAPKSLKSGSVMDILGNNHMLPDVTASTGLKPAPELKNESVMSILGPRK